MLVLYPLLLIPTLGVPGLAYRILIFSPTISKSHMILNARVAETLAGDGHTVTLLEVEYDEPPGSVFVDEKVRQWTHFFDWPQRKGDLQQVPETNLIVKALNFMGMNLKTGVQSAIADLLETDIVDRVRAGEFDVIFGEQLSLCWAGIGKAAGINTHIWLSSCPLNSAMASVLGLPFSSSWVPSVLDNRDISDDMSMSDRWANFWREWNNIRGFTNAANEETELFKNKFGENFPPLAEIAADSALVFVNVFEFIDFPRPITSRVISIGGITVKAIPVNFNWTDYDIEVENWKGVVYFSLGTMIGTTPQFMDRLFSLFTQFPDMLFVVRIDETDPQSKIMGSYLRNVKVVDWVDQEAILCSDETRLFITHGGYDSLLESAYCATPVLVLPVFGDQFYNGLAVQRSKWGVKVDQQRFMYSDDGLHEVKSAIKVLPFSENYKAQALRMQTLLKAQPLTAAERIRRHIRLLESVDGNVGELLPRSRLLPFWRVCNLDLAILVSLVLFLWSFVVWNTGVILSNVLRRKIKRD